MNAELTTMSNRAHLSPKVPTDKGQFMGVRCGDTVRGVIASPAECLLARVIHNLASSPFWDEGIVRRMPERRPSREPICPCTVAVLADQEGEQ